MIGFRIALLLTSLTATLGTQITQTVHVYNVRILHRKKNDWSDNTAYAMYSSCLACNIHA